MAVVTHAVAEAATTPAESGHWEALRPGLARLDALLARAVAAAETVYGPAAASDPFRGLHVGAEDIERLLAREPGAPLLGYSEATDPSTSPAQIDQDAPLARLARQWGLSAFDIDVILIALAPEVDLGYERLYAYLQDDVTRRRATVDLALGLLCSSPADKLVRRAHFAPDGPLLRHGLIRLTPDPQRLGEPLLAHALMLDGQIVDVLLGQPGIDRRLAPFCHVEWPGDVRFGSDHPAPPDLIRLVADAASDGRPVRFLFHGSRGVGKHTTGAALARAIGAPLLYADLRSAVEADPGLEETPRLLVNEASFHGAVLYLDNLDVLAGDERRHASLRLRRALDGASGITILAGAEPAAPDDSLTGTLIGVPFAIPDAVRRRHHWQAELAAHGVPLTEPAIEALAGRFRLTQGQIAAAVSSARARVALETAGAASAGTDLDGLSDVPPRGRGGVTARELFAAARARASGALGALARKIEPVATWDNIVLPDDSLAQLRELCGRVVARERVLGSWGFGRKLSSGTGTGALFVGPSGTGKTMAAEIVANDLGLDLYAIDLAGVVSKYIGETEKNLDRVFAAAGDAILFFDEADALFGKRSEVRDAHDRYANVEISYLLQKMERYEGVTILATNLRQNLDPAFIRRLAFTVNFPFPSDADRRRIWAGIWPSEMPLAEDVDADLLADRFPLSGGSIKNIALAAAFLAAEAGDPVSMAHLFHATHREYQKLGKSLTDAELYGTRGVPAGRGA